MASAMTRLQQSCLSLRVWQLCAGILILGGVFFAVRILRAPSANDAYGAKRWGIQQMEDPELSRYMSAMKDTRPAECLAKAYPPPMPSTKVSIILHFNEHQFYDAKLALHALIENTPDAQYSEILLVDDGTKAEDLRQHASEFLDNKRFKKIRVMRSEDVDGEAASRFKASKLAVGSILVFISTKTVVNKGWLTPLVHAVESHNNLIATPHVDNFLSDYRFFHNKHTLVNVFTWTLGTYHLKRESANDGDMVDNPVIRGDAFAIHADHLANLGDYDDALASGGGESLELSLRTWLCGGQIKVVPCSRVVTHNALEPLLVHNPDNLRRIAELWFGAFKPMVYKLSGITGAETHHIVDRRKRLLEIRQHEPCHALDYYLANVAPELVLPSAEVEQLGLLADRTGHCVMASGLHNIELQLCNPHTYHPNKVAELTSSGKVRLRARCLEANGNQVVLKACHDTEPRQHWQLSAAGHLTLKTDTGVCLTHDVEQISGEGFSHHLIMQTCQDRMSREQSWKIDNY